MTEELYRITDDEDMLLELQAFLDSLANMRILPDAVQADLNEFVELLAERNCCPFTMQEYAEDAIGVRIVGEGGTEFPDIDLETEDGAEIVKVLNAGNVLRTVPSDNVTAQAAVKAVLSILK